MGIKTRVDIDFSQLGITWAKGTEYRIELEEGFVVEDGGAGQPNPLDSNFFTFTSNATGPVIESTTPSTSSILATDTTLTFNYDRKIILGTGNIDLYKVGSPDELVFSYDVLGGYVQIGEDDSSLVVTLNDQLNVSNTQYYFLVDSNIVKDADNFYSDEVTNTSEFRYTSATAPSIVATTPTNYSTLSDWNIVIEFNKTVKRGSGTIQIVNATTDAVIYQFPASTDTRLDFNDEFLTINCSFLLNYSTSYYITIEEGAITGATGVPFVGFTNDSTWTFTTSASGTGWFSGSFSTAHIDDHATSTWPSTGITYSMSRFRILYPAVDGILLPSGRDYVIPAPSDDNWINNTKGVHLYDAATNTLIHTFYSEKLPVSSTSAVYPYNSYTNYDPKEMTTGNNALYIALLYYLEVGKTYYILIDDGAFYDPDGLGEGLDVILPGISDPNIIRFTWYG